MPSIELGGGSGGNETDSTFIRLATLGGATAWDTMFLMSKSASILYRLVKWPSSVGEASCTSSCSVSSESGILGWYVTRALGVVLKATRKFNGINDLISFCREYWIDLDLNVSERVACQR